MKPTYKRVKVWMPHCPTCGSELLGNNSIAFPWACECGTWKPVLYPFTGEYEITTSPERKESV